MSHEISQVTGRHRVFPAQPTVGTWTDIGKAEVVHTMFGKAKVRIIREQSENRRTGRLLMALAATALGVAAWQGWVASVQTEAAQSPDIPLPAVAEVHQTVPALQTDALPRAMPPSVQDQPMRPAETETPPVSQGMVSPKPAAVTAEGQPAPKPATVRRLKADAPQNAVVAGGNTSLDATDKPAATKPAPAKQPAVTSNATPRIAKAEAQNETDIPPGKVPAMTPPVKEPLPAQPPAADKQPATPPSGQGQ
jgi:hypothetical protein